MHTFGVLPSPTYDDLHYLAHNAFLNERLLKIKPIEKWKTTEEILFNDFNKIVTKKTQGVSSKFFALFQKFSDFVPRSFCTLTIFPTVLALAHSCWMLLGFRINVK